ncbi:MAG TPA: glycosyltransferase family 4 protein [Polyangia bacterium]|nr:glycosyltransferase family 4 protein [Polyangia bacterium]
MTRERWLFVDPADSFGGHEVMLTRLVEELVRQGRVRPRVLARDGTRLRERLGAHATAAALPSRGTSPGSLFARLRAAWRDARAIWGALRVEAPSLCVVAEGSILSQPIPALVCRLAGTRVAVYLPLTQPTAEMGFRTGWLRDRLMKLGFAQVPHAWIVLTADQARSFASWTGARRPILVLPNTVAPEIEQQARAAANDPAPRAAGEALRIVVLGRLDVQQKGLDLLLDHLDRPDACGGPVQVRLVGDGPSRAALATRVAGSPRLAARVRIEPWANPVPVLQDADVLLLPSRYEGVPLVMLEAMALGVPVVASSLPGTRPFVDESCLFPVGRLDLAFAIVDRLRDPATRADIARINRATFAAQASHAAFSRAVAALSADLPSVVRAPGQRPKAALNARALAGKCPSDSRAS